MLINDNVKTAWSSLKSARWRSLLTMLGIIVGVASVITIVSLGEGLKQQVKREIGNYGNDLITVRPGQSVQRDNKGRITHIDLQTALGTGTLSQRDVQLISRSPDIASAAPLSLVSANLEINGRSSQVPVIATSSGLPDILQQKLAYGGFWTNQEEDQPVAILGRLAAQSLFGDNVPFGQSFRLRGQNFLVRGIFDQFPPNPLLPTVDFNRAVFIPYPAVQKSLGAPPPISLVLAKPTTPNQLNEAVSHLTLNLLSAHAGQEDFTILKADENSLPSNAIVQAITRVIVGIAAVSLVMGGVGIMNIMLVAVTERTREIGIRKAVGATNRQILGQFLVEATVLSLAGAAVGLIVAFITDMVIRLLTTMQPAITLWVVLLAAGVSIVIGVVFGIVPAFQAARKDPIDALRYE